MAILPKKTGAVWLGPGEVSHDEDRRVTQHEARRLFLAAIQDEAPEVLATLAKEPLTVFRPLLERTLNALSEEQLCIWHLLIAWNGTFSWNRFKYADPDREPEAAELRDLLNRWAQKWNLDSSADDWIMEWALDTLLGWCAFPALFERDGPTWNPRVESMTIELTDEEQAIAFPAYRWNPQWERLSVARKRILGDVQRRLAEHFDRVDNLAKDRGLVTTPKRSSGDAHFRWLVFFQILKLEWRDVAKRADRADSMSVRRDALAIAAIVGLTPREGRGRGQPRKRPHIVRRTR